MAYTDYHWITDRIAVGAQVTRPDDLPFDAVISLSTHAPSGIGAVIRSGTVSYHWFPVVDDFCDGANEEIVRAFDGAADAIHRSLEAGDRVLVHCMGGISRSATAVIWYLMRYEGFTWEEGARLLREKRSVTNPDISFELPLRLARGEPLDDAWIGRRIEEYVEDYRQRLRSDRGRNLDAAAVREALVRQGTLPG